MNKYKYNGHFVYRKVSKVRTQCCECSTTRNLSKYRDVFKNDDSKSEAEKNNPVQPVWLVMNRQDTQQYVRRNNDNIIVNPWAAGKVETLLPVINMSSSLDTLDRGSEKVVIENTKDEVKEEQPIYEEIQHHCERDHYVINIEKKVNKDATEEVIQNRRDDDKEIIYWQITTKEVAKYQPCTEIFIERS